MNGVGSLLVCSLGLVTSGLFTQLDHSYFIHWGRSLLGCSLGWSLLIVHGVGSHSSFTALSHSQFIHGVGPRRCIYISIPMLLVDLLSLLLSSRSPDISSPSAKLWPIFQALKLWNIIPCLCSQSSRTDMYETLYIHICISVLLTVIAGLQKWTVLSLSQLVSSNPPLKSKTLANLSRIEALQYQCLLLLTIIEDHFIRNIIHRSACLCLSLLFWNSDVHRASLFLSRFPRILP